MFSYEGRFWSYQDVAMWPRPVQQPHPPIWVPVDRQQGVDRVRRAAQPADHAGPRPRIAGCATTSSAFTRSAWRGSGHRITPDHLSLGITAYVADSKAQALKEYGPHILYFNRTLFSHGNFTETEKQRETGYATAASTDYVRPENLRAAANLRSEFRNLTMADLEEQAETMPMGTADEVAERIIDAAESAGANQVQLALNRGCPAARSVHGPDRALRPRSPAAPAGARSEARPGGRGGDGVGLRRMGAAVGRWRKTL